MLRSILLLPALPALLCFLSCKKDAELEPPATPVRQPELVFNFKAVVKDAALSASATYTNALADSFSVSMFSYYISNIQLKREDGFVFKEAESYHLNKHLDGLESFTITGLPEGNYTDISFLIGVDSTRNVSGAQSGALDVTQGMFWDWNTGYVFFKLEGLCNTAADPQWKDYAIHVGGFSGPNNCLQTSSVHLSQPISAKNNRQNVVLWHVHVEEIFANPLNLSFDSFGAVSGGKPAKTVSANYKDMFEVHAVEN